MPVRKISVVKTWMLLLVPALLSAPPALRAQLEPINQPSPFMPATPSPAPGPRISLEREAHLALNIGLASIAAELFRSVFEDPATSPDVRNRVAIHLATALIEEDRVAEAGQVLQKVTGLPTPALRLRRGMIAVRERRLDAARVEIQGINPDDFTTPYDRGWYFFLRGQLADNARDAQAFFEQAYGAASAAGLEAQRAWFQLAQQRLKLQTGGMTESQLAVWQKAVNEGNRGTAQSYQATSQLAVGYASLGRRSEAIEVLRKAFLELPPQERAQNDEWQLLLALIAGPEDGTGWIALSNLLVNSTDRDRQRAALRLLFRASKTPARRDEFGKLLDELISRPSPHPILEYLLLSRAQIALADAVKRYPQIEADAERVLAEFPNSPLKAAALGVLTEAAWEQLSYRRAATRAAEARAELPAGEARAQLGVLQAEAYFRAAEFRTAADAYGAALAEVPAGVPAGDLMFQRVLSAINAGQLSEAERILDELSRDPRLDAPYRWQMEWNLARALQAANAAPKAYERVNRLLGNAPATSGLPADLRVSMAWLQARLAFENNDPARTLVLTEALIDSLDGATPSLKAEIASNTLLLRAQAGFASKDSDRAKAAIDGLQKLRTDYPASESAAYSYIVEADAADAEGRVLDAQRLVVNMAGKFEQSEYAPYALYRAALYAERRGTAFYEDANRTLEDLVTNYPNHPLVFYARLKQGNILRAMNDYGRAHTVYRDLVLKFRFPQFPDALAGDIALADTEAALAASDPSRASNAASIYERLYDLPSAPIDLRAEAGHKLGLYRADREDADRAYKIWWPMIEAFVLDDAKAATLGANGRYWMARTILKLAALQESKRNPDPREARKLYEIILDKNLPGSLHANEGLARTGGKPAAVVPNGTSR